MRGAEPVILDFATSAVAEGKVLVAARGGEKLPEGSLIEPDGRLTADPHTLYGDYDERAPDARNGEGAIRAFGEHKARALPSCASSSRPARLRRTWPAAFCERHAVLLHGAVVLRHRRGLCGGSAALHRILQELAPRRRREVLVPGEPERRSKAERLKNGVPLPDDAWRAICATAREVGVDPGRYLGAGNR